MFNLMEGKLARKRSVSFRNVAVGDVSRKRTHAIFPARFSTSLPRTDAAALTI